MFDISKPRKQSGNAKVSPWEGSRGPTAGKSFLVVHPGLALAVNLHPAAYAGGRGSGGHRDRAQRPQQAPLIKQGNQGSVGAISRLHGLTVELYEVPVLFSKLAPHKRSGRGSCSGSQCPQGPLSWPLRAGHSGCQVCTIVSLCVSVCVTVWVAVNLSVWQRCSRKVPSGKNTSGVSLAMPQAP